MEKKSWATVFILFLLVVLSIIITSCIGPTNVSLTELFSNPTAYMIVFDVRLPRVICALFVGAGLAVAGTAMQGLFKNSMADPYIIGTSSGGALGASLAIVLLGGLGLPIFAFLGATGATFIVYALSKHQGRAPVETLLLSGIALSMFLSAILSFIMSTAGKSLHQIMFWLMGGFWNVSWTSVGIATLIPIGSFLMRGRCSSPWYKCGTTEKKASFSEFFHYRDSCFNLRVHRVYRAYHSTYYASYRWTGPQDTVAVCNDGRCNIPDMG